MTEKKSVETLKLSPHDQAYYDSIRALSPPKVIRIARMLQRLAFPGRLFPEGFDPAPLYIGQAYEAWQRKVQREALIDALKGLG